MIKMTAKEYNEKYGSIYKTNKYHAKKMEVDGKRFDSMGEANYYQELKIQEKQGLIQGIDCQAKESFYINDQFICNYLVDFLVYHNDGTKEYAEYKGQSTELWRLKWKMLLAKYKKEIEKGEIKCSIVWHKPKYNYSKKMYEKNQKKKIKISG